jgi:hypothetical protein
MKKLLIDIWLSCLVPALALLLTNCSLNNLAGGSGSTTTNGMVVGAVVTATGKGVPNTQVQLLPASYNPVAGGHTISVDTTDESGVYQFVNVNSGDYNLLAVHLDGRTRALIHGIHVAADTVSVADEQLLPPGCVQVMVPAGVDAVYGYMYIPGTTYFAFLNNRAVSVSFDSVPPGTIPSLCYSSINSKTSTVIRYDIVVTPSDTTVVGNPLWKYARKLVLNTSPTGADVAGQVANFPVLVRLNSENFDFSQAQPSGADIRFTKSDNSFLPCEIERWDASNNQAEVWVKVDTVRGNDSLQSITIYWGNPGAAAQSGSAPVFDTAAGFAGVWHLGQPVGGSLPDATVDAANGTPVATTTVPGIIGAAQSFNGITSLIRTSGPAEDKLNFPDSGAFTVSAWVKTAVLDSLCQAIIFKSNAQYGLQIVPEKEWEFATYIDKTRWEGSRSPAAAGAWHAVAGVRHGTRQYLYVDGMCVDSTITNTIALPPENVAREYGKPLEIGHCPDGGNNPDRFFSGIIDEVRISRTALGADWMKLCFMNQKEQNALVKW